MVEGRQNNAGRSIAEPVPGATLELLQAALGVLDPSELALYRHVDGISAGRGWHTSELIGLSIKMSPGRLARRRYDSPIAWPPFFQLGKLMPAVLACAPSASLAAALAPGASMLRAVVEASPRSFVYAAVDLDEQRFKVYLIDPRASFEQAHSAFAATSPVPRSATYIDCLEADMRPPHTLSRPAYFRLKSRCAADFRRELSWLLAMRGRPSQATELDERVEAVMDELSKGVAFPCPPNVKLRLAATAETITPAALAEAPMNVTINIDDPTCQKYVNDHTGALLRLAEVLGCADAFAEWLEAVHRFDCHVSYLGLGEKGITIYYRATSLFQNRLFTRRRA
jgi:hypothetical protein